MQTLRPALVLFSLLSLLTGLAYPFAITTVARATMPWQASGSLVVGADHTILGSTLIGQPFDAPTYFWGRPSATGRMPYDAAASSGSNLGPTSPALRAAIEARIDLLHAADPTNDAPIPVDLVTASASGLDPDITPAAALYQVARVARARHLEQDVVRDLVRDHVEERLLGVIGEPHVNVLRLNLALDQVARPHS